MLVKVGGGADKHRLRRDVGMGYDEGGQSKKIMLMEHE